MSTNKPKIWSEDYKIASYFVNLRGRAGLYAILNYIQDVGWMHAGKMNIQLDPNYGWVFTRQHLVMNTWPKWDETITIKTWLRSPTSSLFIYRDYEIFLNQKIIGRCTSTFSVIDMTTRKIANFNLQNLGAEYNDSEEFTDSPQKIAWQSEAKEISKFQVRNSDIDMNDHVNNTKYAQWILDAIPLDIIKGDLDLTSYEINFLAETKPGETVSLQMIKSSSSKNDFHFQGSRLSDSKPVFTAKIKTN